MNPRDDWQGFPLRPPKVTPGTPIVPGWTVMRADTDPTAGPVWLVEHCIVRRQREQRLAVVFAEQRPWADTVEWLIEAMSLVPPQELPVWVSNATQERIRLHCGREFPGHGAVGRLSIQSVGAVRAEIDEAQRIERFTRIDSRAQWNDWNDPTSRFRDADLIRVRAMHDMVLWARCGRIEMTDCVSITAG